VRDAVPLRKEWEKGRLKRKLENTSRHLAAGTRKQSIMQSRGALEKAESSRRWDSLRFLQQDDGGDHGSDGRGRISERIIKKSAPVKPGRR